MEDSYGNYYKLIRDDEEKVIQALFFMDSNMYELDVNGKNLGYDNFTEKQVDWYEKSVKNVNMTVNGSETEAVPSLAFFHIPMLE